MAPGSPQALVQRDPCDLCGSASCRVVVEASPLRHATALCAGCGLVRAVDVDEAFDLDSFYEDEFTGDAGGNAIVAGGSIAQRQLWRQERRAKKSVTFVKTLADPRGLSVLDVRCRSGALAEQLVASGASVTAVDFLETNVAHAAARSPKIDARLLTIDDIEELPFLPDASVDVVTALTIHVLAHLPRPSRFLAAVHRVLRPGGLVFLDEKDILRCERLTAESIFDTGRAHLFHFTPVSMAEYLARAGFDVHECRDDPKRRSSFRHIRAVARKPEGERARAVEHGPPDLDTLQAELGRSQRTLDRRRRLNRLRRSVRQIQKRLVRRRSSSETSS